MTEACPVCDTLWRLYAKAADNLRELVGKHTDARGQGEQNNVEILSHEVAIAESSLGSVRREIRRHEKARHGNQQKQDSQAKGSTDQNQKKQP